jgi:hypothetical protein
MVRLLNDFDPVMVDLHDERLAPRLPPYLRTANNPAVAAIVGQLRDWMATVAKNVKTKDRWEFRSYGNVSGQAPNRVWTTVEDLPRYTHNYWGVRNRFGILSETYSYLTFADRVTTARRFVEEVLAYAHTNAPPLKATAPTRVARRHRNLDPLEGGARTPSRS